MVSTIELRYSKSDITITKNFFMKYEGKIGFNAKWAASKTLKEFIENEKNGPLTEAQLREVHALAVKEVKGIGKVIDAIDGQLKASEVIDKIKEAKTIEEVDTLILTDERSTVLKAAETRKSELQAESN